VGEDGETLAAKERARSKRGVVKVSGGWWVSGAKVNFVRVGDHKARAI